MSDYLTIRFINAVFHEQLSEDAKVRLLNVETSDLKRQLRMDLLLEVCGRRFHLEGQSTENEIMTIRMFEYGMASAMDERQYEDYHLTLTFPKQAVIYLRDKVNTPDHLPVTVLFPDGQKVDYAIPTIRQLRYTPEELQKSGMSLLLPFQILRLESLAKQVSKKEEADIVLFTKRYEMLLDHVLWQMNQIYQSGMLSSDEYNRLLSILETLSDYTFKNRAVQKGVEEINMKKITFRYQEINREAKERAEREVRQEVQQQLVEKLMAKQYTKEEACEMLDMEVSEYDRYMEKKKLREQRADEEEEEEPCLTTGKCR